MNDHQLITPAGKIKQYLDTNKRYVREFQGFIVNYKGYPVLNYKGFCIQVVSENKIVVCFWPLYDSQDQKQLLVGLEKIVDNITVKTSLDFHKNLK